MNPDDLFTAQDFEPYIDHVFGVAFEPEGEVQAAFVLREVTSRMGAAGQLREPFTLIFDGPPEVELPQNTYWLEHEKRGRIPIFLVPIAADAERRIYQAVFN